MSTNPTGEFHKMNLFFKSLGHTIQGYRIYSNKRRNAYLIFRATSAVVIRGRRLFKNCTRRIHFF